MGAHKTYARSRALGGEVASGVKKSGFICIYVPLCFLSCYGPLYPREGFWRRRVLLYQTKHWSCTLRSDGVLWFCFRFLYPRLGMTCASVERGMVFFTGSSIAQSFFAEGMGDLYFCFFWGRGMDLSCIVYCGLMIARAHCNRNSTQ